MSAIVVVGSMAFDSIETPFGKIDKVLGGSANHFSLAASYFTSVKMVSVVGEDYPSDQLEVLKKHKIDIEGVRHEKGKTFHWAGKYSYDLNVAQTLATALNVFEHFEPQIPNSYRDSPFLFLGNIAPQLQIKVAAQMNRPKFIALDTMNFWIEGQRDALAKALAKVDALIVNEGEARQLTKVYNVVQAAKIIQGWGPKILVIKRGEYGALLFDREQMFSVPGLPLPEVKDPTGAGDAFAGGFLGYLASHGEAAISPIILRKAVVYGSVMASFIVQEFGFKALLGLNRELVEDRYRRFLDLTAFHTN
jgi:sugar/nucleoside kinase (ribokinase family)